MRGIKQSGGLWGCSVSGSYRGRHRPLALSIILNVVCTGLGVRSLCSDAPEHVTLGQGALLPSSDLQKATWQAFEGRPSVRLTLKTPCLRPPSQSSLSPRGKRHTERHFAHLAPRYWVPWGHRSETLLLKAAPSLRHGGGGTSATVSLLSSFTQASGKGDWGPQ